MIAIAACLAGCDAGAGGAAPNATLAKYTPGPLVASVAASASASQSAADASFSAASSSASAARASASAAYAAAHPSYSSDQVRQTVGQPCSPDRLVATAYGYSSYSDLPGQGGMICTGGVWAVITEA